MLVGEALAHPRAALFALRARGLPTIARFALRESPARVKDMARFARFRSSPATLAGLAECFPKLAFSSADAEDHIVAAVPSGERLLIRKACAWQDAHVINDTFVREIYRHHPPLQDATVLDVGANIGDTAVYFGARGARVVAFEPDPELAALALSNARLNGIDADIRTAGIGATRAVLPLTRTADGADPMSAVLFPGNASTNKLHVTSVNVQIVAFAEILQELGAIRLAKLDCQGSEYPALDSLPDDALDEVEHILLEYHRSSAPLIAKLHRCGYAVRLGGRNYLYADRVRVAERV